MFIASKKIKCECVFYVDIHKKNDSHPTGLAFKFIQVASHNLYLINIFIPQC